MHLSLRTLLETATAAGTLGCLFFYALSFSGLLSFLRYTRKATAQSAPNVRQLRPVSILKPLKGDDPEIWESFCSHAEQQYPEFELIFGVSDPADPACKTVRKLQAAYPARQIRLIVCERILGTNVKVSNLAQMVPKARYEILLVNDSDIRVAPDYLQQVTAPLNDEQVGLVTCLYRGIAAKTLGSRLEALGIGTDFVPGVLSARLLEGGLRFGLGSTLAFRRQDLTSIGGFESLVDYLADDYELGHRISATGKRVELSAATVATYLPPYTLGEFWRHQLRWSRTIRDARRWGYAGLLFTFGLPWALATLIASSGATWAWGLFAATLAARLLVGVGTASAVLRDRRVVQNLVLLPLRDLIAPFVWTAGLAGNRIHWRGEDFHLKDGRLFRVDPKVG
ncbi:MAG: bacteriohopanetetrol glucosamine biosynthesis glycosyltransferase HpnI [Terriglobales bacterium]|jgi:ceramide glucosyltransferase